ncbi:MAG TPA: undecaprenyl-diphosphate phosphatase [Candidatus Saccharibacteria bacterium]|nr:undecaprenyl-diphosphate phosphatase [Candidatus Saccharibacteria bacterium]
MEFWLESVVLGLTQGLTEFIPVSSSGHLVIAQFFFSGASEHLLLEFINIGTLAALLIFFRKKLGAIMRDIFVHRQYRLARNILLTALPAGVVGFFAADFIGSSSFFGSLMTVIVALSAVGLIMIIVDKLPHASRVAEGAKLTKTRALVIGLAQVFALIPGVSRSGATILAGRFTGLPAAAAAEYSFIASIPLMIGVTIKVLLFEWQFLTHNIGLIAVSNVVACLSGLFAIGFLLRYLSKHSLAVFGWYRIMVAGVLLAIVLVQ